MELKDVILSTLAEMEDAPPVNNTQKPVQQSTLIKEVVESEPIITEVENEEEYNSSDEMLFLTSMRERLLVLFEGFQAPNNTNIEAKVDMTLNFLEYVLVSIDQRVSNIEKGTN
jgi:hypothetical protein